MVTIYKISNTINDKLYIGQTRKDVITRLYDHWSDAQKDCRRHRKLYLDMNQIGIGAFKVEAIEMVADDIGDERERYWIDFYGTYYDGYNETLGGVGKNNVPYPIVVRAYRILRSMQEVSRSLRIDPGTVRTALIADGVDILDSGVLSRERYSKPVIMMGMNMTELQRFESLNAAARHIKMLGKVKSSITGIATHIAWACSGARKSAYKYKWIWEIQDLNSQTE